VAEEADKLRRKWLSSPHTIDSADLAIAAAAIRAGCGLRTQDIRHFSMFEVVEPSTGRLASSLREKLSDA
jgi:predicted nucleic acid-binding protein